MTVKNSTGILKNNEMRYITKQVKGNFALPAVILSPAFLLVHIECFNSGCVYFCDSWGRKLV